jgi:CRP/FNR family cyclic AMP-dependent transcriptional regulator
MFAHLDEVEHRALMTMVTRRTVAANETIFWLGDHGDALFVVDSGQVVITAPDEQGDHITLATVGPGGVFGEISLLDGGTRTATARAATEASLLALPREAFHAFVRRHPDVAIGMLQLMGTRQRASTAALRGLKNPNAVIAESATIWHRVSDVITMVAASQVFSLIHITWFGTWILLNVLAVVGLLPRRLGFDPYPFGLLTLIVSLEAIFLSIFVLVSQTRESERDHIRTELDYQVNVKAHIEIIGIIDRLERIERAVTRPEATTGGSSDR